MTQLWLVAYDITHPRRLRRVARVLEAHGIRAQKSVFEAHLRATDFTALRSALIAEMAAGDHIRFYPLCADCEALTTWQGTGPEVSAAGYFVL